MYSPKITKRTLYFALKKTPSLVYVLLRREHVHSCSCRSDSERADILANMATMAASGANRLQRIETHMAPHKKQSCTLDNFAQAAASVDELGLFSLRGRAALVTGVSDGSMGHGIALALAAQGAAFVVCVDVPHHRASLATACAKVEAAAAKPGGCKALPFEADCTDRAALDELFVAAAAAVGGAIHVVVATVGGGGYTAGPRAEAGAATRASGPRGRHRLCCSSQRCTCSAV